MEYPRNPADLCPSCKSTKTRPLVEGEFHGWKDGTKNVHVCEDCESTWIAGGWGFVHSRGRNCRYKAEVVVTDLFTGKRIAHGRLRNNSLERLKEWYKNLRFGFSAYVIDYKAEDMHFVPEGKPERNIKRFSPETPLD